MLGCTRCTRTLLYKQTPAHKKETRRACTRSAVSPPHAKAGGNHTVDKQAHTRTPGQVLVWQVVALQRNNNTHTYTNTTDMASLQHKRREKRRAKLQARTGLKKEEGRAGGRTAHTHGTRYAHAPEVQCRGRRKPFEPSGPNAVRTPCTHTHRNTYHAGQHTKGTLGFIRPKAVRGRSDRGRPPHAANS